MSKCKHTNLRTDVAVAVLEDSGRRNAEIKISCTDCGKPFQFLGLPMGLNLNGAACSPDGTEARLAICPQGEQPSPIHNLKGFTIN